MPKIRPPDSTIRIRFRKSATSAFYCPHSKLVIELEEPYTSLVYRGCMVMHSFSVMIKSLTFAILLIFLKDWPKLT